MSFDESIIDKSLATIDNYSYFCIQNYNFN